MSEYTLQGERRHPRLYTKALAGFFAMSVVAACSADKKPVTVKAVPDFARLTTAGKTCEDGITPRPCYLRLRTAPNANAPIINKLDANGNAIWPIEASATSAGDKIDIACQVLGDITTNAFNESSSVWDVIPVPIEFVDPQIVLDPSKNLVENPRFGIGKNKQGNITTIYAYARNMWLGNQIHPELQTCSPAVNPDGYPPAQ